MATLQSNISIPEQVIFRDLGGEMVLLNVDTGKYYGLDEVGTRMWSLLAEHGSLETAYQILLDEYNVEAEQLKADLLRMVDEFCAQNLLMLEGV